MGVSLRYSSPKTQLALLSVVLLLTTANRRLLSTYLLKTHPTDLNPTYDTFLPTSIIACVAGFVGIFLVNLVGPRAILAFYSATNTLLFSSIVSRVYTGNTSFHTAASIIDSIGYDLGRVATLVVVLAYPTERWKARALSLFLVMEYFAMTLGDIIAKEATGALGVRRGVSIAALCLSCVAPFAALAIAPTNQVVRDNGVYLIARDTTLRDEVVGIMAIFKNKYMLLLIPYMFSYPFLFSTANVPYTSIEAIIMYDVGKIFIILMCLTLDIQWATRRIRSMVSLCMLAVVCTASSILAIVIRNQTLDLSGLDLSWPTPQKDDYLMNQTMRQFKALLLLTYFFAGMASSFIELYGYWVMGTLTNDIKASGRLVGTYQSVMAIGGLVGYQLVSLIPHVAGMTNVPMYVAFAMTLLSLLIMFFVVRRITETNDWTLASISSDDAESVGDQVSADTIAVVADVKYQHHHHGEA